MGNNAHDRIGEELVMNNGLLARIISYRNYGDIDVLFVEHNIVVKNRRYLWFKRKSIKCPMVVENCGEYSILTNPNTISKISFIVDTDDIELVLSYKYWHLTKYGYVVTCSQGKKPVLLHRILLNCSDHEVGDHIDGNTLNNRKLNLRRCTNQENRRNQKLDKRNTSGYKGVTWDCTRNKWSMRIAGRGYSMHDNPLDAAIAYDKKAIELFGEFAKTNKMLGLI